MGSEKVASPTVAVEVVSRGEPDASSAATVVQGTAISKGPGTGDTFKWTKTKRDAFKRLVSGQGVVEVARALDVHRNTITNWTKHPVWVAEVRRYVQEAQTATKLRRLRTTTMLTDTLALKAGALLAKDADELDPSRTGLVLREHLNYVKAERDLFGEGQGESGHAPMVNIVLGSPGGPAPLDPTQPSTAVLAFDEFMAKYDPGLGVSARTPQEAAALVAEKVLQESNLIDIIREEDREELRAEAEAEAERKGK